MAQEGRFSGDSFMVRRADDDVVIVRSSMGELSNGCRWYGEVSYEDTPPCS